jgi:hypothetical protein
VSTLTSSKVTLAVGLALLTYSSRTVYTSGTKKVAADYIGG